MCNTFNVFTHILGPNSTATLAPSVVELIAFAALSWSVIVVLLILVAIFCSASGKQSVKDTQSRIYSQAMREDLVQETLVSHL